MLPINAPKPKNWTDKDRWICTARYLDMIAVALNDWVPGYNSAGGLQSGEKGDPCYECPVGERCPCWCDETHWKRFAEIYAFENFKIVEQFLDSDMEAVNAILKAYYDKPLTSSCQTLEDIDD